MRMRPRCGRIPLARRAGGARARVGPPSAAARPPRGPPQRPAGQRRSGRAARSPHMAGKIESGLSRGCPFKALRSRSQWNILKAISSPHPPPPQAQVQANALRRRLASGEDALSPDLHMELSATLPPPPPLSPPPFQPQSSAPTLAAATERAAAEADVAAPASASTARAAVTGAAEGGAGGEPAGGAEAVAAKAFSPQQVCTTEMCKRRGLIAHSASPVTALLRGV